MEKPVLLVTGLSQRALFKRTEGHIALAYLVYCTKGIILLQIQIHNLPEDSPAQIATALFQHVHCQSHKQADRHVIYKILESFIQNYKEGK
jgi:hypothetical protein